MSLRDLPPLAAIRVFEAAARRLSFTQAAEELGMTQAAVSYQIKVLEERLGAPLFLRRPRAVELTPAGHLLAPAASEALETLAAAFSAARENLGGILSISVLPTFAAHWLAPRIGEFQMAQPDIAVRITATRQIVEFGRDNFDLSIRAGDGNWPGIRAHRLMKVDFTPMFGPRLVERLGAPKTPQDLLNYPLIDPGDEWWRLWFAEHGIAYDPPDQPDSQMGDQHLAARAAIGGQGLAILSPGFYTMEIENGLLLQSFDTVAESRSYWLCYPENRRNVPKIRAFRDWILGALDATPPPPTGVNA